MSGASPQLKALTEGVMRRRPVLRRPGRPLFPYGAMVRVSLWISVAVVAVLFGWGA